MLLTLAASIAVAQCGLPSSYYLAPPGQGTLATTATPNFSVIATTSMDASTLRGFDLYYKFYATDTAVQSTLSGSSYTISDLTTAGFRLVCSNEDSSDSPRARSPLFQVPIAYRGTGFTIKFTVSKSGAVTWITTDSAAVSDPATYGAPTQLRRCFTSSNPSLTNQAQVFDTFTASTQNYSAAGADPDFGAGTSTALINALATSSGVYLAIYAVSVGYDSTEGPIYSYPIFLGVANLSDTTHYP
jgi:hypothetical protein